MSTEEATWVQTACILCECNCGVEIALDGRTLDRIRGDKAHPASQGYTCNKAMRLDRYQNGPHRLTSPMRRRPDGSYEEIDWDTAIAEIAAGFARIRDEHGGESIFYYGGGGQGNHLGGALQRGVPARRSGRATAPVRSPRRRPARHGSSTALRQPHARRVRARRGLGVHRQEPVDVAELPAGARGAQRDREGPRAVDDRDRPRCDRHGKARRLPPAGAPGHGRLVPGGDGRGPGAGGSHDDDFIAEHVDGVGAGARTLSPTSRSPIMPALWGRRGSDPRRGAPDRRRRERGGLRGSRHPAGPEQHAVLLPEQAAVDPAPATSANRGGQHLHSSFAPLFRAGGWAARR